MASGCILILSENKKEGRLWKQEQTYQDKFMTNYSPRNRQIETVMLPLKKLVVALFGTRNIIN